MGGPTMLLLTHCFENFVHNLRMKQSTIQTCATSEIKCNVPSTLEYNRSHSLNL